MNTTDFHSFDLDDDDLRRRFDTIAARADMPVVDPLADLRRARDARRRRRLTQAGGGLVAAAAVSALVLGTVVGGDVDAGEKIANDPTPTAESSAPDESISRTESKTYLRDDSPESRTFIQNVEQVLGRPAPKTDFGFYSFYELGQTSLVTYGFPWSERVTLDIRAGLSRDVLKWELATNTSAYPVGDGVGERGTWHGSDAFLFDQHDGEVVLVLVDGPAAQRPSDEVIETLLTELDVPTSTLTAAQAWQDTMMDIGIDHMVRDTNEPHAGLSFANQYDPLESFPSVFAEAHQGKRRTGHVEWQAQTITADTPDCPAAFNDCSTVQIGDETFLAKTVASGEREGWLYLERDHANVRAQIILQPYQEGWSVPLDAAAELLLDGRWSELAPESSVDYPAP